MHQHSFLAYRHFLYLKLSLLLALLAVGAYLFDPSLGPRNGGTVLGYTLGGVGSALILLLLWLGVRKRAYHSRAGTLQGWVSAHVYLGLALALVVTLHSGFQFGWNVHTLAYVLMWLVIASGLYGIYVYLRYPLYLNASRGGMSRPQMLREVGELDQECLNLARGLEPEVARSLEAAIENTLIGGSPWQQLRQTAERRQRGGWRLWRKRPPPRARLAADAREPQNAYDATMYIIAEHMAATAEPELNEKMRRVIELLGRKNALLKRLRRSIQYQALLEVWLFIHVPLSFALLAALIVHVVTVFLYW